MSIKSYIITVILLALSLSVKAQYLHVANDSIVDENGQNYLLRGMGLGGWMIQEGYMLEIADIAGPQHEIRAKIEELVGVDKTNQFYDAWYLNHCTKRDIDSLKAWGFNSVRLPMHYNLFTLPIEDEPVEGVNTWLEKGFEMTDSLLSWCKKNEMYLILDLHGAPGGQGKNADISDYDPSKPSLWESDFNKSKTVALWRKLAERYADEKWIGGYDLINEVNWAFTGNNENGCDETTNAPLRQLYEDITEAIREVDQNHILFIEGNCWANNHNGLLPFWDDNMVLSFHKYWSNNGENDLDWVIEKREQYNVPLWLGEAGENSNTWFRNAIKLMEDNNVGWAWWPLKKFGSVVCPLTVERTAAYDAIVDYWKNGGTTPTQDYAFSALMGMTENLKIENNTYHPDVIDAMFRQQQEVSTIPYKNQIIPGVVSAAEFDMGRNNYAYFDVDTANYQVSSGNYTAWNQGWSFRNDGVDIQKSDDSNADSNGYNVGWTANGEWMKYTVNVTTTGVYTIAIRYASTSSSSLHMEMNNGNITGSVELPSTGGYQNWQTQTIPDIVLYEGENELKVVIEEEGANLGFYEFELAGEIENLPFESISAKTNQEGDVITLQLNKKVSSNVTLNKEDFSVNIEGNNVELLQVDVASTDSTKLNLQINTEPYLHTASVVLDYTGTSIVAQDATVLQMFSNLEVENNRPPYLLIPGKIEAEDFTVNQGLVLEETSDVGGGYNIGYTDVGDYLIYQIYVQESADYKVDLRVAGKNEGRLLIEQLNELEQPINEVTVTIPNTGDWQNWETIDSIITLAEGYSLLKLTIVDTEFNVNWMEFVKVNPLKVNKNEVEQAVLVYPNPVHSNFLVVQSRLSNQRTFRLYNLYGDEKLAINLQSNITKIEVTDLPSGIYLWAVESEENRYSGKLLINK